MAQQFGKRVTLQVLDQRLLASPPQPAETDRPLKAGVRRMLTQLHQVPATERIVTWDGDDPDAQLIRHWLSELRMLKGVPFNYLVADMAMLPVESLRFFQVDPGWLTALLDGAFSIGSAAVKSSSATDAAAALRGAAEGAVQNCEMRQAMYAGVQPVGICEPLQATTQLSGFLLRSSLLAAWPGLEVQGLAGDRVLSIVRMELLAPGVLLCLFNDRVTRVRFTMPAEASHFGVRGLGADQYDKPLRSLGTDPGAPIDNKVPVNFRDKGRRVISLSGLASQIKDALPIATLDSAGFALQMVEGAQAVEFTWSTP